MQQIKNKQPAIILIHLLQQQNLRLGDQ